jgi:hypothetical protein
MAGTIDFKDATWTASGGVFRALAAGVMEHLSEDEASIRVAALLREAIESHLLYLNFSRDFDGTMRATFGDAFRRYLTRIKARGAAASPAPDLYPGFVERLDELATMMQNESRG